jgi:CubicO group peptidase (beta-lactamase class C family)
MSLSASVGGKEETMLSRFVAILLVTGAILAQNVNQRMDQIAQSYVSNKQFMGSVLVARDNEVLLSKGYGSANLEWEIPNAPSTKFRLGSITKQFTAVSILLLEERGKLTLDDLVKKHLPDAPAAWDNVTIFHLLTHTSGIPSFTGFPDYRSTQAFATTPEKLVARFRDRPLEFAPGERMNYSNSGYVFIGYLIERIAGESYESFLQKNVFTPLGMKDSGYDSNFAVIARRAVGYEPGPNGPAIAGFIHMSIPHAAGALYSTTEDLLRWEQGLFGGKVLSAASLQKMITPFKNNYALGVTVVSEGGRKVIAHGGGIEGFNTALAYYPDDKLTVVVLGNLNGQAPDQIARQVAAVAHGETVTLGAERKEITLDAKALSRNVGAYQLAPGVTMLVTLNNNQLISQLTNQGPIPIFPMSETRFFPRVVDAELEFSGNDNQGRATQVTLRQNGRNTPANRLDDAEFKRLTDAAATLEKRVKDQTAMPGSEAALRRVVEEVRNGTPNYDLMGPNVAATTRQQLPQIQATFVRLGSVESVSFKGVGPAGADIYQIQFANGALEMRIALGADGKLETIGIRPLQ